MAVTIVQTRESISVTEIQNVIEARGSGGLIRHVQLKIQFSSGGQSLVHNENIALKNPVSSTTYDTENEILGYALNASQYGTSRLSGLRSATALRLKRLIADAASTTVYFAGS
ncbi:MAG: hypothetical protein JKY94_10885 [Rhodobacteraceae bacterium]|nr:hypothetical protein [Paracoccaceae bacterium]